MNYFLCPTLLSLFFLSIIDRNHRIKIEKELGFSDEFENIQIFQILTVYDISVP